MYSFCLFFFYRQCSMCFCQQTNTCTIVNCVSSVWIILFHLLSLQVWAMSWGCLWILLEHDSKQWNLMTKLLINCTWLIVIQYSINNCLGIMFYVKDLWFLEKKNLCSTAIKMLPSMLSSSHVETMMVNLIKKMDLTYQLFYGDHL